MKNFKSHFRFNAQERSGIFFLLLAILALFCAHIALKQYAVPRKSNFALDNAMQSSLDSLKELQLTNTAIIHPFNPNYISDYKGYTLGLSAATLDKLHRFRAGNNYVNSAKEFQDVTGISDSLLKKIAPYFEFPEWVAQKKQGNNPTRRNKKAAEIVVKDLNKATAADLREVPGIGDKLSARIIKFRDRLGGFYTIDQLEDVYGLAPRVAQDAKRYFQVSSLPTNQKININTASAEEIARLIYIPYSLAEEIVIYRSMNGGITAFKELAKIEGFPEDKIDRIALYLIL